MGGERGRLHSGAGFLYLVRENDERRKGEGKWWKRINLALELSWLNCPILAGWIFFCSNGEETDGCVCLRQMFQLTK